MQDKLNFNHEISIKLRDNRNISCQAIYVVSYSLLPCVIDKQHIISLQVQIQPQQLTWDNIFHILSSRCVKAINIKYFMVNLKATSAQLMLHQKHDLVKITISPLPLSTQPNGSSYRYRRYSG